MSNRLRLLFIVPRFASVNRGVETFTLELISRLDTERFAITVLSAPHEVSVSGVTFQTASCLMREKLFWLDRMPWLARCLRPLGVGGASDVETFSLLRHFSHHWPEDAFDVVVPLGGTWSYRFARKVLPAAKVVSIGQAGPVSHDLARSDVFVALTPHDEYRARQMRQHMRTCVIPNGVDTRRFAPSATYERSVERVILCAAALVPDKGHELLFNAVKCLPGHVRVRCVGGGPHRSVLEQHPLAKEGRVEFCQHAFADMPDVYRSADVFSLASPGEAFGIVFVEAMAAGLPVVAHDGPRQRFVVGEGGVLCDVRDPLVYAKALMSVLDTAPSQQAQAQAMKFDWRKIATQYESLLLSICSG